MRCATWVVILIQKRNDKECNKVKQYIIDAFTDKPFSGNPAAVCVMDKWPEEESMMKLAMENNLKAKFPVKNSRRS